MPERFFFGDEKINIDPPLGKGIKYVRLFCDITVVELFINDGLQSATKVVYPDINNLEFENFQ